MVSIRLARLAEVGAIHRLRRAAADDLTRRFGKGGWSHISLLNTLLRAVSADTLFVIEEDGKLAGTFTLDRVKGNFYLRSMSVQVESQRNGIGRRAMVEIENFARNKDLRAIRLDAYSGRAGAGDFYRKCGYTETGRGVCNGVPAAYYEKLL